MFVVLYTKSVGGHSRTSEKVWLQFETAELAHNFMVSSPENNYVVIEGEVVTLSAKVEVKRSVKLREIQQYTDTREYINPLDPEVHIKR